jgi:hypothetical protein
MPDSADYVRGQRQARARSMGLCGARIGHLGVCDMPAGHDPIGPWDHSEQLHPDGPLGSVLDELREARTDQRHKGTP